MYRFIKLLGPFDGLFVAVLFVILFVWCIIYETFGSLYTAAWYSLKPFRRRTYKFSSLIYEHLPEHAQKRYLEGVQT